MGGGTPNRPPPAEATCVKAKGAATVHTALQGYHANDMRLGNDTMR